LAVSEAGQPPVWAGPASLSLDTLGPTIVELVPSASDPEGAALVFTVSAPEGLTAEVQGSRLVLTPSSSFESGELALIISDGEQLARVTLAVSVDRDRHALRDASGNFIGKRTRDDSLLALTANVQERRDDAVIIEFRLPPPPIGIPEGGAFVQDIAAVTADSSVPVQLSSSEITNGRPVRLEVPLVQGIVPRTTVVIGGERFVIGKVIPDVDFAGTSQLIDRADEKLDLALSQDGASAAIRGLLDVSDVDAAVLTFSDLALATPVFAAEVAGIDDATITLPATGQVSVIRECPSFDVQAGTCPGGWQDTVIPFTQAGNAVTFTVTHFSGYAGG
ncbi:MAG: hypothetical protein ACREKH_16140, partial [Candidatus Rokuibacteriota bacterium]